jgi:inosine-uridine nucleoside N-ribohydrolase
MNKRKIIFDMDPGIDDAIALIMATRSAEIEIIGITTVAGNVPVELGTRNALSILEYLDIDNIPVIEGAQDPLAVPFVGARGYHGEDGLGEIGIPSPILRKITGTAWNFIAEQVLANPGEITLLATGPLTNLAIAFRNFPELPSALSNIVIMGGAYGLTVFGKGNRTPFAEFNIWQDPDAAQIVFDSTASLYAIGLDISHDPAVCLNKSHLELINRDSSRYGVITGKLLDFVFQHHDCFEPHDPLALAAVIDKSLFHFIPSYLAVMTQNDWKRGATYIKPYDYENHRPGTYIAQSINETRFIEMFLSRLINVPE